MTVPSARGLASVALPLVLAITHAASASAQVRPVTREASITRPGTTPPAAGPVAMMSGPHHALAMAYGENLATFARAVNVDATRSNTVNMELARPATVEMRRSYDQMKVHHQAQMSTVGTTMRMPKTTDSAAAMTRASRSDSLMIRPPMPAPMRADSSRTMTTGDVRSHLAAIETHLGMLETEVQTTTPNAAKVIEHTAAILKVRRSVMGMSPDSAGRMGRPDAR